MIGATEAVHSFRTLLDHLGTLAKVTCRPRIAGAGTFLKYPQTTSLKKEAFDLLGLKLPAA